MQKHYNYLNIDLDKKIHTKLKAKQGDSKSRYILVNLISNSTYYDLSDCAVKIYGIKKDKTIFFNHATVVNGKQGQFEVELTTQALSVPGEIEIQILILGTNQEKLTTFSFFIDVEKTIIDDAAIESTNEFTALTEALSSVQNIDNKFAKVDEQFNTIESGKATKVEVDVERKRIDSFTNLAAGSTTGDAELIDARIGADGVTYSNVGNAIRTTRKDTYYPLTNGVVNSEFNGVTGWSSNNSNSSTSNGEYIATGKGEMLAIQVHQTTNVDFETGDKLFICFNVKSSSSVNVNNFDFVISGTTGATSTTTVATNIEAGKWYSFGKLLEVPATLTSGKLKLVIRENFKSAADSNGVVFTISKPLVINITKSFKDSSLMSELEVKNILSKYDNWFNGTINLYKNNVIRSARDIKINDVDNNFNSDNVENALKELLEKSSFNVTNLVKNGNFKTTDNWSLQGGTATVSDNRMIVTSTGLYIGLGINQKTDYRAKVNDIIYCRCVLEEAVGDGNVANAYLQLQIGASTTLNGKTIVLNNSKMPIKYPYTFSENFKVTIEEDFGIKAIFNSIYSTGNITNKIKLKGFVVLNLTDIFGAGNEPNRSVIDTIMDTFDVGSFDGTSNLLNGKNVYKAMEKVMPKNGASIEIDDIGRVKASSVVNPDWEKWEMPQYGYGMSKNYSPVFHEFNGTVETNAMFSVRALGGRWSGALNGDHQWGGHVFEAWNNLNSYRGTHIMGKNAEDEYTIIVYNSPSVPTENGKHGFGTVRIGSDIPGEGYRFAPRLLDAYGNIEFSTNGYGIIMKSPNGTRYKLKVNDDGSLTTTKIVD